MLIKTAIIRKTGPNTWKLYSKHKGKNGKRKHLATEHSLKAIQQRERAWPGQSDPIFEPGDGHGHRSGRKGNRR